MFRLAFKYLSVLGLSLVPALPFLWHLGIYELKQEQIRKEVKVLFKAGLDITELDRFEFSQESYQNLEWEDNRKEFLHAGRKYDVYSVAEDSETIIVYAWLDEQESELKQKFDQLLAQHHPQPQDQEEALFQLLKQQHLASTSQLKQIEAQLKSAFPKWSADLIFFYLDRESPPPRLRFL